MPLRQITSAVWGLVPATVLTDHLLEATWDPTYPNPCDMYAYARDYGVVGCKHPGMDITLPQYTRLYAAEGGTVNWIRNPGQPGRIEVRIMNAAGHLHLYTHLEDTPLAQGNAVTAGQFVGRVGVYNSAHLHFEKRIPDASLVGQWRIVDPEPVLLGAGIYGPTGGSTAVFNAEATAYRKIGDVKLALYQSEFKRKNSPMTPNAQFIWESARPHSGLCLAQMLLENQYASTGTVILAGDYNQLGLRPWIGDPTATHYVTVIDYQTRASVGQTMKVPPEAVGVIRHPSGGGYAYFLRYSNYPACVREWKRRIIDDRGYKGGVYNNAISLEQMCAIYAPSGDVHPDSGVDNAEIGYAGRIRTFLRSWAAAGGGETGTPGMGAQPGMAKPPILLVAGHRSTGDPGNPVERELTDDLALAYDRIFKAAGYTTAYFQRDVDRDANASMTVGDLGTVAVGCRNWLGARTEPLSIMLDLHYNGSTSPVHTIVPDVTGLTSGFVGGAPADDTAAVNALDKALAEQISRKIVAANPGMTLWNGRFGLTGVMSERDTGVALSGGWRLGMFGATAVHRKKAVRLVVEHGGTNDAKRTDFFNRCARAALEAVQQVIPNQGTEEPPVSEPEPQPDPANPLILPPGFNLATVKRLFGQVGIYSFDPNGVISNIWRQNLLATGRAPKLENVWTDGTTNAKYFQFSDGMLIYQGTAGEAFQKLGPTP